MNNSRECYDLNQCWYVYIIRCSDGTLYTGVTKNLISRISRHNSGTGAKYTRGRLPVTLVYSEPANDHSSALRREYKIKQLGLAQKLRLINDFVIEPSKK